MIIVPVEQKKNIGLRFQKLTRDEEKKYWVEGIKNLGLSFATPPPKILGYRFKILG